MAGLEIRIDAQSDAVSRALKNLEGLDLTDPLDEFGSYLDSVVLLRFDAEEGPEGASWTPSQRALKTGDKTLQDHGHLRDSITHNVLSATEMEHGSDVIYAAIHQLGGEAGRNHSIKIEPRPFLGINTDDEAELNRILEDHIEGLVEGAR